MDYFRIVGEQRYLLTLKKFHSLFLYSLYLEESFVGNDCLMSGTDEHH